MTAKELLERYARGERDFTGVDLEMVNLSRADLSGANLSMAYLSRSDLSGANLSMANLSGANLSGSDLSRADLSMANLSGSDLLMANLSGANLSMANLSGANLSRSDLLGSDLSMANLSGSDLLMANLSGANLDKTVLDPTNKPNGNIDGFRRRGKFVYGYRTRKAGHIQEYLDGRSYNADYFSTCEKTDCHPGLYIWPTIELARKWSKDPLIKVRIPAWAVHKTPTKWRCVEFYVMGGVE